MRLISVGRRGCEPATNIGNILKKDMTDACYRDDVHSGCQKPLQDSGDSLLGIEAAFVALKAPQAAALRIIDESSQLFAGLPPFSLGKQNDGIYMSHTMLATANANLQQRF